MTGVASARNTENATSSPVRRLPSRSSRRSAHAGAAADAADMGTGVASLAGGAGPAGTTPAASGNGEQQETASPLLASHGVDAFGTCDDPDAQATVTDFLDFTEYLPSDIVRSLTLIGQLDETYTHASIKAHELTNLWGCLPSLPPATRPAPAALRADISTQLNRGLSARAYAHAESLRMAENVKRHYHRAQLILAKLQTMLENYPAAEQQQQEQMQQKQQREQEQQQQQQEQQQNQQQHIKLLQKKTPNKKSAQQARMQHQRVPRITVPGEVLAPYELDYDDYSGDSDVSSPSSDDGSPPPTQYRRTTAAGRGGGTRKTLGGRAPGVQSRMKMIQAATAAGLPIPGGLGEGAMGQDMSRFLSAGAAAGAGTAAGSSFRGPKTPKVRMPRPPRVPGQGRPPGFVSTSTALARLRPPPENAVIGSADAPWLQLTPYELAKLRKRMKKNATWTPSETMIARELKLLGRNLEAFRMARQKAEDEGRPFDALPAAGSGGATTAAATDEEAAKRLNNSQWAQLAAQEAEESARRLAETARALLSSYPLASPAATTPAAATPGTAGGAGAQATSRKRKRDTRPRSESSDPVAEGTGVVGSVEAAGAGDSGGGGPPASQQRPLPKRVKTETPVPIPQPSANGSGPGSTPSLSHESSSLTTPAAHQPQASRVRHSTTPVPAPVHGGGAQSVVLATTTTTVPLKAPSGPGTPAPPPPLSRASTPTQPPTRELRTRDAARKDQQPQAQQAHQKDVAEKRDSGTRRASVPASRPLSRAGTPVAPAAEGQRLRSSSRAGAVAVAVPAAAAAAGGGAPTVTPSLASERPRRASTVFNTTQGSIANEGGGGAVASSDAGAAGTSRPTSRRGKRPAPGIVSRTSSGGSAAVGRRKVPPRKKRGSNVSAAAQQQQQHQHQRRQSEGAGDDDVEVDDEGQVIDPDEPRYCVCNRVSFGTMIQCDNVDNCKQEWFHLECVGMTAVPARTTKWYCPDCRVLLNIGEKGEVNARGVRK